MTIINLRLRHGISLDHLIRAIQDLEETEKREVVDKIVATFSAALSLDEVTEWYDCASEVDQKEFCDLTGLEQEDYFPDTWYKDQSDEDKREFLTQIGVMEFDISPVKMTESFPVNNRTSSDISRIGYNLDECRLEITFERSGGHEDIFQYAFIAPYKFKELLASDSIGRYFQQNIKGQYAVVKC